MMNGHCHNSHNHNHNSVGLINSGSNGQYTNMVVVGPSQIMGRGGGGGTLLGLSPYKSSSSSSRMDQHCSNSSSSNHIIDSGGGGGSGGGLGVGGTPVGSGGGATTMFNVHWDDFNRVVVESLWALLTEESLTDCTLVVSPLEQVQVHRVVLSANSPYFRSLLQAHSQHPNPIIILQDISYTTLKMLVTFMYRGQVSVTAEEMASLLKAADHLQIIGLTQTRRSPVNFTPTIINTTPTQTPTESPVPLTSSTPSISSSNPIPSNMNPVGEAQQVYSKKSRILEQNKNLSSSSSSSMSNPINSIGTNSTSSTCPTSNNNTPLAPGPLSLSSSSNYSNRDRDRDSRDRDYEMVDMHHSSTEQQSPLSLKKEDESESNDWDDKHMDELEQSTLCLRYCCPYCSTNFPSQSSLSRHIMVVHPTVYGALYDPVPSTSQSIPPQLNVPSSTATNVIVERESQQPQPPPPQIKSQPTSPPHNDNNHLMDSPDEATDERGGILCKFCGKPFPEVSQLIQHLPIHTGERPFKCEYCGKAFKLRHHMKDHARVHTGERPFRCSLCGKNFSRSTILKAHEKTHFPKGSGGGSGSTT